MLLLAVALAFVACHCCGDFSAAPCSLAVTFAGSALSAGSCLRQVFACTAQQMMPVHCSSCCWCWDPAHVAKRKHLTLQALVVVAAVLSSGHAVQFMAEVNDNGHATQVL